MNLTGDPSKDFEDFVNHYGSKVVEQEFSKFKEQEEKNEYARQWGVYCRNLGFKVDDLGKEFFLRNEMYKIVGIKTNNRKYPILAERVKDKKLYKFTVTDVKNLIN